jgi:hypothetical protein
MMAHAYGPRYTGGIGRRSLSKARLMQKYETLFKKITRSKKGLGM